MPLAKLLPLAQALAHLLREFHRRGGVHRRLCPANIRLSHSGQPTLAEPEAADPRPPRDGELPAEPGYPLEYMAPEQTGRTAHPVDNRSDLYALGATLYEAATGSPPFGRGDPLQLVQDHLSRQPASPRDLRPELPEAFSAIILKLLAKEPAQRYQGAEGLSRDLARASGELQRNGAAAFALGEYDFPVRLAAPLRLLGREQEAAALLAAFQSAMDGGTPGVLVTGPPGVGKTALVNGLQPSVLAHRGWFVTGKFDVGRWDREADGLYQALRALGRLLLAEPEQELALIRARALGALGPSLARRAARIPEFGLLLGAQPQGTEDNALLANDLRIEAVLTLLRAIASPARPVVISLDNLQWAGSVPIAIVHALLTDRALRGLLVVGIYGDMAPDPLQPLAVRLAEWTRLPRPPSTIAVGNLQPAALAAFLVEMLRLPPPEATRLAEDVGAATGGNPFDVVQLLDSLRHEGALALGEAGWTWDERVIRRHIGQSSVSELLVGRIALLAPQTRQLVDTMACLGGRVALPLLETAAGIPPGSATALLGTAVEDGLVLTVGDDEPMVGFGHDRVQQVALDHLAGRKQQMHLALARRLEGRREFRLAAAKQYVHAVDAIVSRDEQLHAAQLLADAGNETRKLDAAAAEACLEAAIRLHRLAGTAEKDLLGLHTRRHAVLFEVGRVGDMEPLYAHIASLCGDSLQLAEPACLQVCALSQQARAPDAVALGREVLESLGFPLPGPGELARLLQDASVFSRWQDPAVVLEDLRRPDASDPRALAAGRLIARMLAPSASADPALFAALLLAGQDLWVRHGPAPQFVEAVSSAAFLSISTWQDYRTGHDVARAVLRISEGHGYPEAVMARFVWVAAAAAWHTPLEDLTAEARGTLQAQLEIGELHTACLTLYCSVGMALECASLDQWADEIEAGLAHCRRIGHRRWLPALLPHRQLARMLRGETEAFGSLEDASFSWSGLADDIKTVPAVRATFHLMRGLAAAFAGDSPAMLDHARQAGVVETHVHATYAGALGRLLLTLGLAQQLHDCGGAERAGVLKQLDASQAWFAARSADASSNFQHLARWIDAERAWAEGDTDGALLAFDEAQQLALPRPRPWHKALLTERTALFLLQRGLRLLGERTMAAACEHYAEWGASAKVRRLREQYPFLVAADAAPVAPTLKGTSSPVADSIDLVAVLRASQALSSSTSLASLKSTVVELLAAMTGATSVQLALYDGALNQWLLCATSAGQEERLRIEEAADRRLLPLSAFQYALRTLVPLVVDDAACDPRFGKDVYFSQLPRCSLLVLPIVSQGTPLGMLLLENRLSSAAFGRERLGSVVLIAGQLAVSLENAMVYEGLEQRVHERTRELQAAQAELVATARRAGMAEIATNVLHNVGNILNSVNVSADLLASKMRGLRIGSLARAVRMLQTHSGDLGDYLTRDEKGKLLPLYLGKAVEGLEEERAEVIGELAHLTENLDHIKNVVATQQSYAGTSTLMEQVELAGLLEDALRIHALAIDKCRVVVKRDFGPPRTAELDKTRVMQILVNLIGNAVQAMEDTEGRRELTVSAADAGLGMRVLVADTGVGIPQENMTRIFSHGFTTRKTGHGFGLHSCALAARELEGTLVAASDGPGRGAVFTLELPGVPLAA